MMIAGPLMIGITDDNLWRVMRRAHNRQSKREYSSRSGRVHSNGWLLGSPNAEKMTAAFLPLAPKLPGIVLAIGTVKSGPNACSSS
jgi:hypothetical protein